LCCHDVGNGSCQGRASVAPGPGSESRTVKNEGPEQTRRKIGRGPDPEAGDRSRGFYRLCGEIGRARAGPKAKPKGDAPRDKEQQGMVKMKEEEEW
jgi:hypothetical protein